MIGPYLYRDNHTRRNQLRNLMRADVAISVATMNPSVWGTYGNRVKWWPKLHSVTFFSVYAEDLEAAKALTALCGTGDFEGEQ